MGILKKVIKRRKILLTKRKREAICFAHKIAKILVEKFGAEQVILYGSLTRQDYFDYDSDIDLAVKGVGNRFFSAYGYCMGKGKFELDIRDYDDMPAELKEKVKREGIILYEKRIHC